jgi:hypothetical protein
MVCFFPSRRWQAELPNLPGPAAAGHRMELFVVGHGHEADVGEVEAARNNFLAAYGMAIGVHWDGFDG